MALELEDVRKPCTNYGLSNWTIFLAVTQGRDIFRFAILAALRNRIETVYVFIMFKIRFLRGGW